MGMIGIFCAFFIPRLGAWFYSKRQRVWIPLNRGMVAFFQIFTVFSKKATLNHRPIANNIFLAFGIEGYVHYVASCPNPLKVIRF